MSSQAPQQTRLLPDIEAELDSLKVASVATLREEWKRFFDTEPPGAFGPDLMRRSIAQKLQERAYGGLNKNIQRILDKLVDVHLAGAVALPAPRRIRSGAILQREWQGVSHAVMVSGESYLYQGKAYSNLSQIARLITGTRWNGPRFFGLRNASSDAKRSANSADPLPNSVTKPKRQPASSSTSRLHHGRDAGPRDVPSYRSVRSSAAAHDVGARE